MPRSLRSSVLRSSPAKGSIVDPQEAFPSATLESAPNQMDKSNQAVTSEKRKAQRRWSEEEDKTLYEEAQSYAARGKAKDWHRIATKLPGRTNKDCRKRWVNHVCGSLKKGGWDEDEDERLLSAVQTHGQKWAAVASVVGCRSPDQCAKRWQNSLDPKLDHKEWDADEDDLLLRSVAQHGREWKMIQEASYPNRSRNELKNRYTILTRDGGSRRDKRRSVDVPTRTVNTPSSGTQSKTDQDSPEGTDEDSSLPWSRHRADGSEEWEQLHLTPWTSRSAHGSISSPFAPGVSGAEVADSIYDVSMAGPFCSAPLNSGSGIPSTATEPYDYSYHYPSLENGQGIWPEISGFDEIVSGITATSAITTQGEDTIMLDATITAGKSFGKVLVEIDGCDRDTLDSILDITKAPNVKAKIEISSS